MKVTQDTEIFLDGQKYLLEKDDDIIVNEGIASSAIAAMLSIANKFFPIDLLKDKIGKMDPNTRAVFSKILQDPEKAQRWAKIAKSNPDAWDVFA